jgi:molybdopterin biosynthesis enzyme
MATKLAALTRHKCFISYHHDDEDEVEEFIEEFDNTHDLLIASPGLS